MKKKHMEILKNIQKEVPQELRDNIMKVVKPMAFMKELMEIGIADDEFPEEKKSYYKNIIATGELDREEEVENEEVTKQIDEFIINRIKEEVDNKTLPKSAFKHLFKKTRKYVKRTNKNV